MICIFSIWSALFSLSLTHRSCSISRAGHAIEGTSSSLWSVTLSQWLVSASLSWKICWTRQRTRWDSADYKSFHQFARYYGCICVLIIKNHLRIFSTPGNTFIHLSQMQLYKGFPGKREWGLGVYSLSPLFCKCFLYTCFESHCEDVSCFPTAFLSLLVRREQAAGWALSFRPPSSQGPVVLPSLLMSHKGKGECERLREVFVHPCRSVWCGVMT